MTFRVSNPLLRSRNLVSQTDDWIQVMGYALCYGFCCACHKPIAFNPHLVPSLRVNGVRRELCESCANRWNALHPENAQPINPKAYEPMDESEL